MELTMHATANTWKPFVAMATSALLGALLVLGAVAMLGNSSPSQSQSVLDAPRVIEGIGRFNTTDIRVLP